MFNTVVSLTYVQIIEILGGDSYWFISFCVFVYAWRNEEAIFYKLLFL